MISLFNKIKSIFRKIVPFLKNGVPLLLLIFCIVVVAAIWFAGPWLTIEGKTPLKGAWPRSFAIFFFLLFCACCWGIQQARRLNKLIKKQKKEKVIEEDPIKGIELRQTIELNAALKGIKKHINRRDYLYALPWYIVLGEEGSGKTSLINRSGQDFAFTATQRASGARSKNIYSFDLWVGKDAVLIDPDGELISQKGEEDGKSSQEIQRRLWSHFLGWLGNTRSKRPLNGVVVTLNISKMSMGSVSARQAYASTIRGRLHELMETLHTRCPVYVVLTKLDLLYGFEPFFRHYSVLEREEVLGFMFSSDSIETPDIWLEEFDSLFENFIHKLNNWLPRIFMQCNSLEERSAVYSFVRVLAGMADVLKGFFEDAFQSDQFSTPVLMRGVYMGSVFQESVPVNAFINHVALRYRLSEMIYGAQDNENSVPFFTNNLFKTIIYPEASLAADSYRVIKRKRKIFILTTLIFGVVLVTTCSGWHHYYFKNMAQADAVLEKVNVYTSNGILHSTDMVEHDLIDPLNTIRSATLEYGVFRDKSFFADMGLYQGDVIGPKVEETYLNLLSYKFLPILIKDVVSEMMLTEKQSNARLDHLRVFRMLVDKSNRHDRFIEKFFASLWQKRYEGQKTIQTQLMEHLEYALKHTDLYTYRVTGIVEAENVLKPYDDLIASVQHEMRKIPLEQRVYRSMKQNAAATLGLPLELNIETGPVFDLVYSNNRDRNNPVNANVFEDSIVEPAPIVYDKPVSVFSTELPPMMVENTSFLIPKFFTGYGFKNYFVPHSDDATEFALIDNWVVGNVEKIDFSEEDKNVLRQKIKDLYLADYTTTWRNVLNRVNLKYIENIDTAVYMLDQISGAAQPVARLLAVVKEQTLLFPVLPEGDSARKELVESARYKMANSIANSFSELNGLTEKTESVKNSYLEELTVGIEQLNTYMKSIQTAQNRGKAALYAVQARLNLSEADPIFTLGQINNSLPQPVKNIVEELINDCWRVIMEEAVHYLEVMWFDDVYSVFARDLALYYPFNPDSRQDASLRKFEEFFAPEGTLGNFNKEYLKLFQESSSQGINMGKGGQSIIRKSVLDQLETAENIRKAFFNSSGSLDVQFLVKPVVLSSKHGRSLLYIDGQYIKYNHGLRRSTEVVWPNTLRESATSKLTLIPPNGSAKAQQLQYVGSWAFFRLLDQAKVTGKTDSSINLRFSLGGGEMEYEFTSDTVPNPFTRNLLQGFSIPKRLY